MNKNEKTFRLVNKNITSFSIIIANFQYAATFLFHIRDKIVISFVASLSIKLNSIINLRKVKLIISKMSLIIKITQIINTKTIKLIIFFRQIMKFISIIYLRNPISITSKAKQKLISIINEGKLSLVTSPVFVILYTLGHWDIDTLLILDSMTLGSMDYTIV